MADGLFGLVISEVGSPFDHFDPRIFWNARGGVAGWGSICGALPPACAFIGLFVDTDTQMTLVNELMAWYQQETFPVYQPKGPVVTTVANSTLCHVSISKWLAEAGVELDSKEKKERCGGLSADVAKFTIAMLNNHFDNKFEAVFKPHASVAGCKTCHSTDIQGKDSCLECHDPLPESHP